MKNILIISLTVFVCLLGLDACKKNLVQESPLNTNAKLSYGDSILYIKGADYKLAPVSKKTGIYKAFPENLNIDATTGEITVSVKGNDGESQTGLRYKITFSSSNSEVSDSTYIVLSGINYPDKFYYLSQNDSIIYPIYNADVSKNLPAASYDFDNRLALNPANGQINIKETIRRGFFNDVQPNTQWKQTTVKYSINDGSVNTTNTMDIILYYYNTLNDIPAHVSSIMQAHQKLLIGVPLTTVPATFAPIDRNISSDLSIKRPRPPCIVIVGL